MHDLRRTPSNLLTPAIGALLLLTGCTLPDLGDATTDGTDGNDTGASDGADSTGGVPGDCAPLEQTDIDTDATLPAGCYEVSTLLFLESRLELSPDAQLYFGANTGLQVFGSGVLVAVGTVDAPVLMTSAQGQGWSGIQLSGAASSENQLDWVRIEDAAADAVALDPSSRLQVSNSEISGAGGFGFTASPGAEFTLATTVIEDCAVPVAVGLDGVEGIAADNTLTTNTEAVVQVEGGTLADDAQWIDPGVPLQLTGNAFIEGALGVGPGLEIEMPQDAEFSVATAGSLTAEGTAEAPIVLRGIQDERGYWQGISFASNDSANILRHCEVANGGSDGWNGSGESVAAVWLAEQSRLEMSDSTIRASDGAALTSFGGANMTGFANNRIEDNRQTIKVSPNMIDEIEASNTFVDNDEAYVRVGRPGANNEVIATPSTWPGLEVPYRVVDRFFVEAEWTLAPGVVLESMQDVYIVVETGAALNAVGTEQEPIRFVGAEPVSGYWRGLEVRSVSAQNELRHVELRHAGSSGFNGSTDSDGSAFISGTMTIADAVVSDSGGYGLVVWSEGQLMGCSNVSFENITDSNVFVSNGGSSACP